MRKSLVDIQIEAIAEANGLTVEEAAQEYLKGVEHKVDFNNLPSQQHNWVDRGLKHTCENAGHPYHEAWKVRKLMTK